MGCEFGLAEQEMDFRLIRALHEMNTPAEPSTGFPFYGIRIQQVERERLIDIPRAISPDLAMDF